MTLEPALDEFELQQRRLHRGEEGRLATLGLAALREFLIDYSGFVETEEVTPRELLTFLLEYYPSEEEPDLPVALSLLNAATGLALFLVERGQRSLAPFVEGERNLREDLGRVLEARALLVEFARKDDLRSEAALVEEEEEEEEQVLGSVSAGVDRVARLDQIDYAAAQIEYFTVAGSGDAGLALTSVERDALGEGPADPVKVPARAAELLRAGDIIHAEIAPGPAGWELLEVFGVRPGGYL